MEEFIFKKLYNLVSRVFAEKEDPDITARKATLNSLKPRLTLLARSITRENISLLRAEREGGWKGNTFFLPEEYAACSTKEGNEDFYRYRVCYLSIQKLLELNWTQQGQHGIEESRRKAEEHAPQVLEQLFHEFPRLGDILPLLQQAEEEQQRRIAPERATEYSMLWGRWMTPAPFVSTETSSPDSSLLHQQEQLSPTTEREAAAREEIESFTIDKEKIEEYTLSHSFEKAETIEEFQGHWRDTDGGDDLADHEEALKELNLRQTVRSDDISHAVLRAELALNASAPESKETSADAGFHYCYDEWDTKKRSYKENYCRVYPSTSAALNPEYARQILATHRPTLQRLRKQLSFLYHDTEELRRQPQGDEPDFDALIDAFADIHAGKTPSENLYVAQRKRSRDLSFLLLADSSLSTDSYTNNRRVIDVERQALLLFGEVLGEAGERFQIDAFFSHTRNHCHYTTVKGFNDSWGIGRSRIGAMEPRGYTRIGPAIRHATTLLEKEATRHRWIILLSDGKPNDYDRYEGRYGIEDVRQAVREAAQKHINIFALAVEAEAKFYFPQMFGRSRYRILPHPALLPEALADVYSHIAR